MIVGEPWPVLQAKVPPGVSGIADKVTVSPKQIGCTGAIETFGVFGATKFIKFELVPTHPPDEIVNLV